MARPRARAGRVPTPERLLDAAEAEFAALGFAAARLEDVARRAGIRRPSLLHHFPTKAALFAAVLERGFRALGEVLTAAMDAGGPFERRLDALVLDFARFLERRPALAPLVVRELLAQEGLGRELLLDQVAPLVGRVERYLRREGRGRLRPGLPVRAALMQVCGDALLRASAGDLRAALWGPGEPARRLARSLFLAVPEVEA
jgi:AcrR family transcriptional regulator